MPNAIMPLMPIPFFGINGILPVNINILPVNIKLCRVSTVEVLMQVPGGTSTKPSFIPSNPQPLKLIFRISVLS